MLNDAHIAEEIRQLCATERPSVAVVDCMLLPALSAVQESGIPHAVLSHTFRGYLNGMHRLGVGSAARLYGYRISELWNAADLNLVTTVAWLDPESRRPQPDNVRWIGAAVPGGEPPSTPGSTPGVGQHVDQRISWPAAHRRADHQRTSEPASPRDSDNRRGDRSSPIACRAQCGRPRIHRPWRADATLLASDRTRRTLHHLPCPRAQPAGTAHPGPPVHRPTAGR